MDPATFDGASPRRWEAERNSLPRAGQKFLKIKTKQKLKIMLNLSKPSISMTFSC